MPALISCPRCSAPLVQGVMACARCGAPLPPPQPWTGPEMGLVPLQPGRSPQQECQRAMWAHLGALLTSVGGVVFPLLWLGQWIVPMVLRSGEQPGGFAYQHATESLNFQLTKLVLVPFWLIAFVISAVFLVPLLVVIPLWLAYAIFILVVEINGSMAGSRAQLYRYPICFRFVR